MRTETEMIAQLDRIIKEIEEKYETQLTYEAAKEAYVTVKALKYIVENIDTLSGGRDLFYFDVQHNSQRNNVAIHLETYNRFFPNSIFADIRKQRKKAILEALPIAFIDAYGIVSSGGTKGAEKIFLSQLSGECIDARTAGAIDFSAQCTKPLTFTDRIGFCAEGALTDYNEQSPFSIFLMLYHRAWEKPYSRDIASSSPCQKDGVFDISSFGLLATYLELIYPSGEGTDRGIDEWLKVCKPKGIQCEFDFLLFALVSAIKNEDKNTINKCYQEIANRLPSIEDLYALYLSMKISMKICKEQLLGGEKEKFDPIDRAFLGTVSQKLKAMRTWDWHGTRSLSDRQVEQLYCFFTDDHFVDKAQDVFTPNQDELKELSGYIFKFTPNQDELKELSGYIFKKKGFKHALLYHIKLSEAGIFTEHRQLYSYKDYKKYSDEEALKVFDLIAEGTEIVSALKDQIHRIAAESEDVAIKVRAIVLIARIAPLGAVGYAAFVHNVGDNFQNYGKIIKSILASEIADNEKSIIMAAFFAKIKQLIQASFADPVEAPQDNEQVRALFNLFIINNLGATPFMLDCNDDVKRKVNDRLLQLARDSEMQGKPLREARSAYCAAQEIMGEDDARRYEKRVSSFKNKNDSAIEKIRLKSAELEQRNQTDAEDAINALIASLDENYDQYFTEESMDLETYQRNINEAISRARDVLEIHRGKKQIIAHIAVGVITGGVGLAAAMVINKLVTNRYSLFKTDSEKKLNRLGKTISSECSRKGIAVR